jgi:hypothetical protein
MRELNRKREIDREQKDRNKKGNVDGEVERGNE